MPKREKNKKKNWKKIDKKEEEIDEINIIYDFNLSKELKIDENELERHQKDIGETISKEKLFGERFVKNNKDICKMVINGKEEELCSYLFNYKNYTNKGKSEMKLKGIKNIIDSSYMFSGCLSLSSLPNISKWNVINIINMRGMFFYCSSLLYIDDISNWKTKNVIDILGIFQYYLLLK